MAQSPRASTLLLLPSGWLAADLVRAPAANRARGLASLRLVSLRNEWATASRKWPGRRVATTAVAATTAFVSLLPPRVLSVQQSAKVIVAKEHLDRKLSD